MKSAIATAALVALCATAHAEFWDGNKLHNHLNGSTGEQLLGLGYVMGVADALQHITFCPPSNVTAGQVRDMVANYLSNVPADRHLTADGLISKVLKGVWPCAQRPAAPSGRSL